MKKEVRVANEKAVWRLRKANQLQRDFTRQVLDPSFLCPMFALPDGSVVCRASDRDVALAVSEELRRANDVALKSKKKELQELNRIRAVEVNAQKLKAGSLNADRKRLGAANAGACSVLPSSAASFFAVMCSPPFLPSLSFRPVHMPGLKRKVDSTTRKMADLQACVQGSLATQQAQYEMHLHSSKRAKLVADGQVSRASEVAATAVKAARGLEKRVAAKTSEVEILRTVVADTAHQRKVWAPFCCVTLPPPPP
jgi:hypothetical protein